MARLPLAPALAALLGFYAGAATAANHEELPSDIITGLLPLTSYAIAHFKDDDEGEAEFLRSNAASLVLTSALRLAFNQTDLGQRPNGKGYGFPSGHAAFVTSSAAFLQDRYGWHYGLPAYALVGYVDYIRVDSGHHYWRDVIAGTVLSYGVSKLFVTPQNANYVAPIIGPKVIGLRWERSF